MILTNPPTERLNATALGLPMLLLHLLAVALLTCILLAPRFICIGHSAERFPTIDGA